MGPSFDYVLVFVIPLITVITSVPCPFNPSGCTCSGDDQQAVVFENATCTSSTFTSPMYTYDISNRLTMFDNNNPPNYQFSTFKSIEHLSLTSTRENATFTPSTYSLFGIRIDKLSMTNYTNLLPLNEAIKGLGRLGLKEMNFNHAGDLNFDKDYFQDFKNLESFTIDSTSIDISEDSFTSLKSVTNFTLKKTSFTTVPSKALANLANVKQLDLSDNPIEVIQDNAVRTLETLNTLILAGTSVNTFDLSVLNGAYSLKNVFIDRSKYLDSISANFDYRVPLSLESISVTFSNIEFIHRSMQTILDRPNFKRLDLSNNPYSIICDNNLAWLAPYILCDPIRVLVDNSMCQNSQMQVKDFVRTLLPGGCSITTTTQLPAM